MKILNGPVTNSSSTSYVLNFALVGQTDCIINYGNFEAVLKYLFEDDDVQIRYSDRWGYIQHKDVDPSTLQKGEFTIEITNHEEWSDKAERLVNKSTIEIVGMAPLTSNPGGDNYLKFLLGVLDSIIKHTNKKISGEIVGIQYPDMHGDGWFGDPMGHYKRPFELFQKEAKGIKIKIQKGEIKGVK